MSKTERRSRKKRVGVVVSDLMDKTVVVQVERRVSHPVYGKVMKLYSKYKVDDSKSEAKTGDEVEIMETRPISKTKRWRLFRILRKSR